jgi:hypothetical protein
MTQIVPLDAPGILPLVMPDRFRREIVYFMTPTDRTGAPVCGNQEYWVRLEDSEKWLDDGFFTLVSPLDAESVAEIELSEDQERWLEWMVQNQISHVRVQ